MVARRDAAERIDKSPSIREEPADDAPLWHAAAADDVITAFRTDKTNGLNEEEARRRIEEVGENVLQEIGRASWFALFVRQYRDVLIFILAIAAGLSFAIGDVRER